MKKLYLKFIQWFVEKIFKTDWYADKINEAAINCILDMEKRDIIEIKEPFTIVCEYDVFFKPYKLKNRIERKVRIYYSQNLSAVDNFLNDNHIEVKEKIE